MKTLQQENVVMEKEIQEFREKIEKLDKEKINKNLIIMGSQIETEDENNIHR